MQKLEEKVSLKIFDKTKIQLAFKSNNFIEKKKEKYMEKLVKIKEEQLNIASQLYAKFDNIEQESGIFLIKPKLSYYGK